MEFCNFFRPNTRFYFHYSNKSKLCTAELEGSNTAYKILKIEPYTEAMVWGRSEKAPTFKDKVNPNIKGFEVDSLGRLLCFNPKFYDEKNDQSTIKNIYLLKGKYIGVVLNSKNIGQETYSVINQDGECFKSLKDLKNFPVAKYLYTDDDDLWAFESNDDDTYTFRSLLKNKKIENISEYPYYDIASKATTIGYSLVKVNGHYGILDLTTMKWKVKPSVKNRFSSLYYASLDELEPNSAYTSKKQIRANRKRAHIYVVNLDNEVFDLNL